MKAHLLAALCLSLIPACGGGGTPQELADAGSVKLSSGDYQGAADQYEKALTKLGSDTSSPDWKRAKMGWIQAQTRIDATLAKQEFLQFATASPGHVTDNDFNLIGSKLGDAGRLDEAIAVLQAGMQAHPESLYLKELMDDLGDRAKASGNTEAINSLKGLGYIGD